MCLSALHQHVIGVWLWFTKSTAHYLENSRPHSFFFPLNNNDFGFRLKKVHVLLSWKKEEYLSVAKMYSVLTAKQNKDSEISSYCSSLFKEHRKLWVLQTLSPRSEKRENLLAFWWKPGIAEHFLSPYKHISIYAIIDFAAASRSYYSQMCILKTLIMTSLDQTDETELSIFIHLSKDMKTFANSQNV